MSDQETGLSSQHLWNVHDKSVSVNSCMKMALYNQGKYHICNVVHTCKWIRDGTCNIEFT